MPSNPTILVRNDYSSQGEIVTVYSPEGVATKVSRLNAKDLTRYLGYTWKNGGELKTASEVRKDEPTAPTNSFIVEDTVEPETEGMQELSTIAATVTGSSDVIKYLEAFSKDSLRDLLRIRYGIEPHTASKEPKLITQILEAENDWIDSRPDWYVDNSDSVEDAQD